MASRLHSYSVDNRDLSDPRSRGRIDRSFHVSLLRGEAARCRLARHRPKVGSAGRFRWVECARCLSRPEPQLSFGADTAPEEVARFLAVARDSRWSPRRADLSAQVLVRPPCAAVGFTVTADGPGGEHDLGLHLALPGLAVYLREAGYGRRVTGRMRLGAERVLRVELAPRHLWWDLWTDRDPCLDGGTSWRHRYVEWAELFLGRLARDTVDLASEPCVVPLPEGGYPAVATLRREARRRRGLLGRLVGDRARLVAWVDCDAGVPVPGDECDSAVLGTGTEVRRQGECSEWVAAGVAHMVSSVLSQRARRDLRGGSAWRPAATAATT